jgi:hypothetical protein
MTRGIELDEGWAPIKKVRSWDVRKKIEVDDSNLTTYCRCPPSAGHR